MSNPIIDTIKSDPNYGTFWTECVGVLDYLDIIRNTQADAWLSWTEKYHPLRYFSGVVMFELHEHFDRNGKNTHAGRVAIFVPTARVNSKWDFKSSLYGRNVGGRKRPMPLITAEKKIIKWQESLPRQLIVPEWLEHCSNLDDLIGMDKRHNMPCQNCG